MPRSVTLVLQGDTNEGSPNRRQHWRRQAEIKSKWKLLAQDAWNRAGSPIYHTKVRLSFKVFRGRLLDTDNLCSSYALVALVNGLKGRCFEDDDPRFVERGPVTQETGVRWGKNPHVEVTIEPIEEV